RRAYLSIWKQIQVKCWNDGSIGKTDELERDAKRQASKLQGCRLLRRRD
ncbi:unnamed protein product, partial [marine sediment metagenome]